MKLASFVLALSVSSMAFADTCFVRNVDLVTTAVSMGSEFCFSSVDMKLDYFSGSKAVVKYTQDGREIVREFDLKNGRDLGDGTLAFSLGLESRTYGGMCSDQWYSSVGATLNVKKDGSAAEVVAVKGDVSFTYDNCHSGTSTKQKIVFEKR